MKIRPHGSHSEKHNPEIDWAARTVKMSRCSPRCCAGCREDIRAEREARLVETRRISRCAASPFPASVEDAEEEESDTSEAPELAEGDRVFAAGLLPQHEEVRATSTMSQRLAEAHWHNSNPASGGPALALSAEDIPYHLREYADVFSKESFDVLPDSRPWDHAVELIPDAKVASCKVYPLSPAE
jgi:hypothetical protein